MQKRSTTREQPERAESADDAQAAVLEALQALARGDFSVRPPSGLTGSAGEIGRAFNDAELNERSSRELRRTTRIVGRQGQTAARASIPGAVGGWSRDVEAINELVDLLTEPAVQVSRVLGAVAAGDLSQRMAVEVNGRALRGEFRRWAELVNTMVDQLNALASEVTRVIVEQHGGQIGVESVEGEMTTFTVRLPMTVSS